MGSSQSKVPCVFMVMKKHVSKCFNVAHGCVLMELHGRGAEYTAIIDNYKDVSQVIFNAFCILILCWFWLFTVL